MQNPEVNALFLDPKGENVTFFKEMLAKAVNQHIGWRESFLTCISRLSLLHPADTDMKFCMGKIVFSPN